MMTATIRARKESLASLSTQNTTTASQASRAKSPTGFSTTTAASDMQQFAPGGVAITRADLRESIAAYENLLKSLTSYRSALSTLSHASASVARSLEKCSRLKGVSDEAALGLQAAGGLHHVIANHEQVLGRSLQLNVEQPMRQHLDTYRGAVAERSAAYERTLLEKSRVIRQTEKENLGIGRRKQRDLNSFKRTLTMLQQQVDELDRLKTEYYENVLTHEEEVWDFVLNKVSYSVRSTLDVYDRVTAKQSDPQLEPLLLSIPDPFDMYGPPKSEGQIFSIVQPLSISMNNASSPAPALIPLHPGASTDNVASTSPNPINFPSTSTSPESPPFVTPASHVPSWLNNTLFHSTSTAPSLVSGSAEWADSPSNSSSANSTPTLPNFPNYITNNGATSSSSANGLGRASSKAESKLRTVLSAASDDGNGDDDALSDNGTEVGDAHHRPGIDPSSNDEADDENADHTPKWRRRRSLTIGRNDDIGGV